MTVTINAVTSTGLVQTSDGSGVLKVQSNGVTTNALAWVNFNGVTTTSIRASYNVSSVTRNGTGDYTVNFTNALSDANYMAAVTPQNNGTTATSVYTVSYSTSAFRLVYVQIGVANIDQPQGGVAIFGN